MTNRLAQSSSPYLLQHAENPVEWYPWGDEALKKARDEDKPIIVSIGYSSCHWCHVMAHESFEDSATAAIMNEHFINIKVDREERPDVDQIYMDAVQKMGLNGGWPLNVFLTPDQKPFYGGTYFPKENWQKLLKSIASAFNDNREKIEESADQFAEAIDASEIQQFGLEKQSFSWPDERVDSLYQRLSTQFDRELGGMDKAPKFPMPTIWEMLAVYAEKRSHEKAREHLLFTLDKMAAGGIYDQVGGGFARYSVDAEWHVPHFEKMLYDNGQLLSIYADAYKMTNDPSYLKVLEETVGWLEREMLHESGGFYAALDADSEGEEGKFYVWTIEEIEEMAEDDAAVIKAYYDIQVNGNWEHGKNVLRRLQKDADIREHFQLKEKTFEKIVSSFKETALEKRSGRIRPGLDDKLIAGWNGLALSGLCEAYNATGNEQFLNLASDNARFLSSLVSEGLLRRLPDQPLEGFMEDYAAVIRGFIAYYQTSSNYEYLDLANQLTERTLEQFYDWDEGFFYFTGQEAEALIARKKEIFDNVIPSSNSMMARNLFYLGTLTYNDDYIQLAKDMLGRVAKLIARDPVYLSNWATLAFEMGGDFAEVVILGPDYEEMARAFNRQYLPMKVLAAAPSENERPVFHYKTMKSDETTIFVCYNRTCKLPGTSVEEAMEQLGK